MANAYPDLPTLAFHRTSVAMADVVTLLQASSALLEARRAGYVIFRNESGNGTKGINNNYVGAQADCGRWPDLLTDSFAGTVAIKENVSNQLRLFLAFKTLAGNIDFLMNRVLSQGLYVGDHTHEVMDMSVDNEAALARAYHKEWVTGSAAAEPSASEQAAFLSMYSQAVHLLV